MKIAFAALFAMLLATCRSNPSPTPIRTVAATPARLVFERGLDSLGKTLDETPPDFVTSEPEIIGVPERLLHVVRVDPDPGRAGFDHELNHTAAFKVPTLHNIALTVPYMHNGAFKTLDDVIDFCNRGGGAGIGAQVPGQTLPARKLELTALERKDLSAFLIALTDTVVTAAPEAMLSTR